MQKYVDDSDLAKILTEANTVMAGISGQKEMDSQEMLEMARRIAANTKSYTGSDSTHFVERSARKVKSKIGLHIDMLKSTAANISQIKERMHKGQPSKAPQRLETKLPSNNPDSDQLGDYNRKIDETLKYLSTRTSGKSQIEQRIKKYREIMGDVEGSLKELPKAIKEGKVKKTKPMDHKLIEKVDNKAEEMVKKMQQLSTKESKFDWAAEGYNTEDDGEGIGDWINHEGFNSKEDLERYNEIFKEFTGEYPKDYEKRNHEEGYYDKDGRGRAIDSTKPGRQRRRGLYSPRDNEHEATEAYKRCKEMEKSLRDVLSRSTKGEGDGEVGSLMSEKRFLEDYLNKKMETIHTGEGFLSNDTTGKKKKSHRKDEPRQKTEDKEGKLGTDGPSKKGSIAEDGAQKSANGPAKSGKKLGLDTLNELKKVEVTWPKSSDGTKDSDEHDINWDMERIKKLIVKDRQEQLRKKREDWERNNELSEEMIGREKLLGLKKGLSKPLGPFDAGIPSNKPSPSDFITDRERREKLYRKATKGKEGIYHKEDLEYEFGVNSFYYEDSKNKHDGNAKDTSVGIRGYSGVRKKTEA